MLLEYMSLAKRAGKHVGMRVSHTGGACLLLLAQDLAWPWQLVLGWDRSFLPVLAWDGARQLVL